MKFEIYLDIDGVLNRWMLFEMTRRVGRVITMDDWPTDNGWDIVDVYHRLKSPTQHKLTPEEFWDSVPESSWTDAPRSELFDLLIREPAFFVDRENVHVVTTVPPDRNPAAYSGKAKWCREHLPEWLQKNVRLVTGKKCRLEKPGRLLVDDADHNCTDWFAAGGDAILVPRPWNANHFCDTVPYVRNWLRSWEYWNKVNG